MLYTCCAEFENFDIVRAAGYNGIVFQGSFLSGCDQATFDAIRQRLESGSLVTRSVNAFCPKEIALTGPGHDIRKIRSYTERLARRSVSLGITHLGIGSPNSRKLSEDYDRERAMNQWLETLSAIADICSDYALQACVEPICTLECNWMNTTGEVLSAVKRLNHPNLGITYDIYHAFAMGEDARPLQAALPYLKLLHISQYINGKKHYLRRDHMAEYQPYFVALKEYGYNGEFAIEATYDPLESSIPASLPIMKEYWGRSLTAFVADDSIL